MSKMWTQLKFNCPTGELDSVINIVSMIEPHLQIDDVSDIDKLDTCYGELIDSALLNADRTVATVSIYISDEKDTKPYLEYLTDKFTAQSLHVKINVGEINEEDWSQNWKRYFKPIHIGERIVVVPAWEKYPAARNELIIKMDPGMAFGTGSHETTRLCATLLEEYMPRGAKVLDIGTGSGILAVAASLLGADHINAYDIDPTAVKAARENFVLNGTKNISCEVSDLLKSVNPEKYDFICANIVADIVLRMARDVHRFVSSGALLAVSGIIEGQAAEVRAAICESGFTHIKSLTDNDWYAMLFRAK